MLASTESPARAVAGVRDDFPAADRAVARALALAAGGVLSVWAAHNALLLPWEVHHIQPAVREPALVALRAVVWMVPVLVYLRRHDPRSPLVALGLTTRLSPRGLVKSAAIASGYLLLIGMLLGASDPPRDLRAALHALAPLQVVWIALAAALEELLMRGFLLGQLLRFTSSLRAQACVAVLFTLMHLPNWIAVQGMGVELVPSTIAVLVLGAVLGAVARASNNVGPAIALHFVNNLIAELMGGG